MKIATSTAQSSVDTSWSSTWPPPPPDTIISKDASPSIEKATTGSPLVRAILESYGKEILESASDQFLDLAVGARLQTISVRELVKLLAKAKRLGYQETDIIDDDETAYQAHEGSRSRLDAIGAPKPPGEKIGQVRSDSTTSPQPSTFEEFREPKRLKTIQAHERESVAVNKPSNTRAPRPGPPLEKQDTSSSEEIRGRVGMQEQKPTSARAAGKHLQRPGTTIGTNPGVGAPVSQSSNVLKRPCSQPEVRTQSQHRKLVRSSAAKRSRRTPAEHIDLVVISDSELESDDDDN